MIPKSMLNIIKVVLVGGPAVAAILFTDTFLRPKLEHFNAALGNWQAHRLGWVSEASHSVLNGAAWAGALVLLTAIGASVLFAARNRPAQTERLVFPAALLSIVILALYSIAFGMAAMETTHSQAERIGDGQGIVRAGQATDYFAAARQTSDVSSRR